MTKTELSLLNKDGWVELSHFSEDEELLSLASSIGQIEKQQNGHEIFILEPKKGNRSVKGTFSNKYGFGRFPLHTDTAFYEHPVRYMLLSSDKISYSKTSILSVEKLFKLLNEEEKHKANRAIYKIKTTERSFFTSLVFKYLGIQGIKYDPTCMFPYNNSAKEIEIKLRDIFEQVEPNYIEWNSKKTVIIDNWKTLHGRTPVNQEENRMLKRIYIK